MYRGTRFRVRSAACLQERAWKRIPSRLKVVISPITGVERDDVITVGIRQTRQRAHSSSAGTSYARVHGARVRGCEGAGCRVQSERGNGWSANAAPTTIDVRVRSTPSHGRSVLLLCSVQRHSHGNVSKSHVYSSDRPWLFTLNAPSVARAAMTSPHGAASAAGSASAAAGSERRREKRANEGEESDVQ